MRSEKTVRWYANSAVSILLVVELAFEERWKGEMCKEGSVSILLVVELAFEETCPSTAHINHLLFQSFL